MSCFSLPDGTCVGRGCHHNPEPRCGDWMQTYTGVAYWPHDPSPAEVVPEDLAHHLALINRFLGATRFPYSVAQHSVHVLSLVTSWGGTLEERRQALLHDAAEAYVGDIIRPTKKGVPAFKALERLSAWAIGLKFGVKLGDLPEIVCLADDVALATEKRDICVPSSREWAALPDPDSRGTLHEQRWRGTKQEFFDQGRELALW